MIFLTSATDQFKKTFTKNLGSYVLEEFHDRELFLKLNTPLDIDDETYTIAATNPPARNILELFFLLDALQQTSKNINLIFTYFGYARQDHPQPMVAQGAQIISKCLNQFSFKNITIIHPHSNRLHQFLSFKTFIPYDLYIPLISEKKIDIIVAPDRGAQIACQHLADLTSRQICTIEKQRTGKDAIQTRSIHGDVNGKTVLIFDDLISTGKTIIQAAELLKKNGAQAVYTIATHSLLDQPCTEKILAGPIEELWVTNSIKQIFSMPRFNILDIGPELQKLTSFQ